MRVALLCLAMSINAICRISHALEAARSTVLLKEQLVTFMGAAEAKQLDEELMNAAVGGFSLAQLMELAGLSVAEAAHDFLTRTRVSSATANTILVLCGPGNNGGDGLVAARHLHHFGYHPTLFYPKRNKQFEGLHLQCSNLGIETVDDLSTALANISDISLIVDAFFGFSFKPPLRQPFKDAIASIVPHESKVLSVDLPSGWDVDVPYAALSDRDRDHESCTESAAASTSDTSASAEPRLIPAAVISLTTPKRCMIGYSGVHYLGGRFLPPTLANKFGILLPDYGFGPRQVTVYTIPNRFTVTYCNSLFYALP